MTCPKIENKIEFCEILSTMAEPHLCALCQKTAPVVKEKLIRAIKARNDVWEKIRAKNPVDLTQPDSASSLARPQYPPKMTMVKNFGKAALRYAASGFKNRTPEEQAKCKQICLTCNNGKPCDFYVPTSRLGERCSKCGCCLSLATVWASKTCPLKRWENH